LYTTILLFYLDDILFLFAVLFDIETKFEFVPVITAPLTFVHKVLDHDHEVHCKQYADDNHRGGKSDCVLDKEDEQDGNHHEEDETLLKELFERMVKGNVVITFHVLLTRFMQFVGEVFAYMVASLVFTSYILHDKYIGVVHIIVQNTIVGFAQIVLDIVPKDMLHFFFEMHLITLHVFTDFVHDIARRGVILIARHE